MKITPVKTQRIEPSALSLTELLDRVVTSLSEKSIVVITSKIVSLCEGSVLPVDDIDRDELIAQQSDLYLPPRYSVQGHHFTIKNNTLIATAGIDQSNGDGQYILWPRDSWKTAREIRDYLCKKFELNDIGVLITDSTCGVLRRGTTGIALGYSGFIGLKNYIGKPDLFGRPFHVTNANIAEGLSASAVVVMGEGAESTPIAIITECESHVIFSAKSPTDDEKFEWNIPFDEDLFSPFLSALEWQKGGAHDKE